MITTVDATIETREELLQEGYERFEIIDIHAYPKPKSIFEFSLNITYQHVGRISTSGIRNGERYMEIHRNGDWYMKRTRVSEILLIKSQEREGFYQIYYKLAGGKNDSSN